VWRAVHRHLLSLDRRNFIVVVGHLLCVKEVASSLISDQGSHFKQLKSLISQPSQLPAPAFGRILLISEGPTGCAPAARPVADQTTPQ
jgi:hypothetical protein